VRGEQVALNSLGERLALTRLNWKQKGAAAFSVSEKPVVFLDADESI